MKKIVLSLALFLLPVIAFAQGGSNYSIFGIGDLFSGTNASYNAMGGTCIAVPSNHSISIKNPALWGTATTTRLMAGYNFNQHLNVSDDNTLYQNNGQLSGIYTLFSIDTGRGISISLGLHSFSNMSYLISNNFVIEKDGISQTGKNTFQGSGGLSSGYIGASAKIIDNLIVGASAFAIFGPLSSSTDIQFDDQNSYNYGIKQSNYASGFGTRLGLFYQYNNWGFGAYYESVGKTNFDGETTYSSSLLQDTTIDSKFKQNIPDSYGFGISYKTGKFLIGSDFAFSSTSKISSNNVINTEYRDAMRFSIGANRIGNPSRAADYLDRVSYKFGFSYQDLYYKVAGNPINEFAFSIGAELPVGIGGIIDAAFVFGTRGINSDNLIKEYFGRMYIELSIGEIWFKPFRRRY